MSCWEERRQTFTSFLAPCRCGTFCPASLTLFHGSIPRLADPSLRRPGAARGSAGPTALASLRGSSLNCYGCAFPVACTCCQGIRRARASSRAASQIRRDRGSATCGNEMPTIAFLIEWNSEKRILRLSILLHLSESRSRMLAAVRWSLVGRSAVISLSWVQTTKTRSLCWASPWSAASRFNTRIEYPIARIAISQAGYSSHLRNSGTFSIIALGGLLASRQATTAQAVDLLLSWWALSLPRALL